MRKASKRSCHAKLGHGVYRKDFLLEFSVVPFVEVVETLGQIIEGQIVVGHAIHSDIAVIQAGGNGNFLGYASSFRDTQKHAHYQHLPGKDQPGLQNLYRAMVAEDVQGLEHSSVEDA